MENIVMDEYLTVSQVASLKGVSLKAVYKAVSEGRLSSTRILGRMGLRPADVEAWVPRVRTVRRVSKPTSEETKRRISETQKLRWAARSQSTIQPNGADLLP
ncbi:MAG TPA: helix-turn-helix domain-containing protein [Abditibacterium sp.]